MGRTRSIGWGVSSLKSWRAKRAKHERLRARERGCSRLRAAMSHIAQRLYKKPSGKARKKTAWGCYAKWKGKSKEAQDFWMFEQTLDVNSRLVFGTWGSDIGLWKPQSTCIQTFSGFIASHSGCISSVQRLWKSETDKNGRTPNDRSRGRLKCLRQMRDNCSWIPHLSLY